MARKASQVSRITSFLMKGNKITENLASTRYGVQNFTATMSRVREHAWEEGLGELTYDHNRNGQTRYFLA
jgi:hypothetical protein